MTERLTVTLPDIDEGVVEGEVIEWLKKVGDPVAQDEPVVIVMTDKATVELPAPKPGVLAKQHYQPGETAIKDHPLYDIDLAGKQKKALATPATRKRARDAGIDIQTVSGSGPEGRVLPEDLPSDDRIPLVGVEKIMAKTMAHAKSTIPHFSYFEALDATRLIHLRENYQAKGKEEGTSVTFMPFLIRALSLTLQQYPKVNCSLDGVTLIPHNTHNIGIAMSTERGLIVPVMKRVDTLTLPEIIHQFEDLKEKAKKGTLIPDQMREGTMTISNFGVFGGGGLFATPIIQPPQLAILAIARIQPQPWVVNRKVVVRDVLNLSWSFDHRVIDGNLAAHFSHTFAQFLQDPAPLI